MAKIGERIGAVLSSNENAIYLLGYGIYEDDAIPSEEAEGLAQMCRTLGHTNPKLRMDDGTIVWGCECWWGSESEIKEKVSHYMKHGKDVINIDIMAARKQQSGQE